MEKEKMDQHLKKEVEILWTGGFDSSFRIIQLSMLNVIIKPYYLSDNRRSEEYELQAIEKITRILQKSPKTKCILLPITIIKKTDRKVNEEISEAYHQMRKNDFLWFTI